MYDKIDSSSSWVLQRFNKRFTLEKLKCLRIFRIYRRCVLGCQPWQVSLSFLISFSDVCMLSPVRLFAIPSTVAHQAPPSMGFFQARILEWVAISFSRGSSWSKDWSCVSCVSCIGRRILYYWHYVGNPAFLLSKHTFKKCPLLNLCCGSCHFFFRAFWQLLI